MLLDALDLVRRFSTVGRKPTVEEFGQVHFRDDAIVAGDGCRCAKVALATGLRCGVVAGCLAAVLRNMSSPYIGLTLDGDRLHLQAGRTSTTFAVSVKPNTLDEQAWGSDAEWSPIPDGLIGAMNLVGFAASRDINTGVHCGALFRGDRVVATDRAQIASVRLDAASHPDMVLDRSNIKLLTSYRDRLTHYCVQGEWSVFSGDRLTFAFRHPPGQYTDKVFHYLELSRRLAHSIVLPAGLEAAVRRLLVTQTGVKDIDRELTLEIAGGELRMSATDGVHMKSSETLPLRGLAQPVTLAISPAHLLNGLRLSRRMHYDTTRDSNSDLPEFPLVAFRSAGMEYLASVEHKDKQEPTEAQS